METVSLMLGLIKKGDFMFSIDLKDAYLQISNHPDSRPYLRIALERKVKAFCFSLSTVPQSLSGCSLWYWNGLT